MSSVSKHLDKWTADLIQSRDRYELELTVAKDRVKECEKELADVYVGLGILTSLSEDK